MKNNNGFTGIGIVIAIVAVLVVGGVAYYAGKSSAPAPQDTFESDYQPQGNQNNTNNTSNTNSNITDTSLSAFLPKEGDNLEIGTKHHINFSKVFQVSDYHSLLHIFGVVNSQGKEMGTICPEFEIVDEYRFDWIAGNLTNSCSGTSNTSIRLPLGKYQIIFTELDSNGNKTRTTKSGWFNLVTSTATYTYKNHGFTMELPSGYIPFEEKSEGGPSVSITLPNYNHLTYWTDASWWAKYNLPEYSFYREETVGVTKFKVYLTLSKQVIYWFQQGNVGYEFSGQPQRGDPTELLKTFRFIGWN